MLGGEYNHSMDAKNRIFIPAKMREELGSEFVIAKSIREKCLKIYSKENWEAYVAPLMEQSRKLSEKVIRFLHTSMTQVSPDAQGRVVLPPELAGFAEINRGVVVVGCYRYAEIWSEENYRKMKEEEDIEALREELESLGL